MAARVCKLSARSGLLRFLASRGARLVSLIFRDFFCDFKLQFLSVRAALYLQI